MPSLRTKESSDAYDNAIADGILERSCRLCDKEAIVDFANWKIITNDFPYDKIASLHHMIVPKRHGTEKEITQEEWLEYAKIKAEYLQDHYGYFMEAANRDKSIPNHFHIHLIVVKE